MAQEKAYSKVDIMKDDDSVKEGDEAVEREIEFL